MRGELLGLPVGELIDEIIHLGQWNEQVRNENTRFRNYLNSLKAGIIELEDGVAIIPQPPAEPVVEPSVAETIQQLGLEVIREKNGDTISARDLRQEVEARFGREISQGISRYLESLIATGVIKLEGVRRGTLYRLADPDVASVSQNGSTS